MRCSKIQKWISDLQDRELSSSRRLKLDDHLLVCDSCRRYQRRLQSLRTASSLLDDMVSPETMQEFSEKLRKRLLAADLPLGRAKGWAGDIGRSVWNWKWGTVVALTAGLVLAVLLLVPALRQPVPSAVHVFTLEETLDQVYGAIGDDADLADLFHEAVASSLEEILYEEEGFLFPGLPENPLFWDDLTDEELSLLEAEIKKDLKS